MIFALGFLACGLATLLFLPAFWRRAVRLSTRRVEMQMPLSLEEIVAERDQLRAEAALAQRRLEQKAESLSEARAADMGELGRRATLIAALDNELAAVRREAMGMETQLGEQRRRLAEVEAEASSLSKEVYDAAGLIDRRTQALAALESELVAMEALATERRTAIAGLETRIAGIEVSHEDVQRHRDQLGKELDAKREEVSILTAERDLARNLARRAGDAPRSGSGPARRGAAAYIRARCRTGWPQRRHR